MEYGIRKEGNKDTYCYCPCSLKLVVCSPRPPRSHKGHLPFAHLLQSKTKNIQMAYINFSS
jgi:hypothetical protein